MVDEFPAGSPYSWHKPGPTHHYNNSLNMLGFVDGHVKLTRMYRDDEHLGFYHIEAWQYEPPPGYEYKWSGDWRAQFAMFSARLSFFQGEIHFPVESTQHERVVTA